MESATSTIKDKLLGIGGCLLYVVGLVGCFALVIMFFRGVPWIANVIFPWVSMGSAIGLLLIVPICLLLAIFKKSRGIGGVGLYFCSYMVGLCLWLWAAIMAYYLAGVTWMIIGMMFGGIGVVPVAFIAAIFKTEWLIALELFGTATLVYALRFFGLWLAEET